MVEKTAAAASLGSRPQEGEGGEGPLHRNTTVLFSSFWSFPLFSASYGIPPHLLGAVPPGGREGKEVAAHSPLFHFLAGDGTKAQLMCEEEEEGGEGKKGTFLSLCCGGERGLDRVRERGKNRKLFVTNDAFHLLFPSAVLYWLTKNPYSWQLPSSVCFFPPELCVT